jgi:hypothetical protein
MRNSSIRNGWTHFVAGVLALASVAAEARTLTLTAAQLHDPHASAEALRIIVEEHAGTASLHLSAGRIEVPQLALRGRLDWACEFKRDNGGDLACAGPVHFLADGAAAQSADLAARVADHHIELALARKSGRVVLTLPFAAGDAITVSLQRVPAAWLNASLAQAWQSGEVRTGVFDADAKQLADGHIEARYKADDLAFNTLDGTVSGAALAVAGQLDWAQADTDARLVADAAFSGGSLHIGGVHVVLPDAPVVANLDAIVRGNGRWDITRFAWRDPQALEFEASAALEPAALAPLRALDVRIDRALFPLAKERYAKDVLAAQGLAKLALKGELSGEFAVGEQGPQRIALATAGLDFDDGTGRIALAGIKGGIDWAAAGEQPATTLAWKSARIEGIQLPASSSRWQSRNGALHLLGSLRTKLLGGELKLQETVLRPQSTQADRVNTAFAFSGIGYDSKDGSLAAAHLAAEGRLRVSGSVGQPRVQVDANLKGGEALAGPVYVKLPALPVKATLDATLAGAYWRIQRFDWNDPGVLDLSANAEIAPADARPLQALQLELRNAELGPALDRYANSWLASKGYGELVADGTLSGALQFDADGLQRFAFTAHAVDLHDGAGRFTLAGLDGGVDWDIRAETPASALAWKSAELFRIPLGAAHAAFESRNGQIVLAKPVAVDVLGGQVRLEKISLQPRSPRGDRYAGSFAVVGVDMAKLSTAFGWPRFGGSLSGGIPEIVFAGDTIELHGGLDLYVFDGHLGVSGLVLQRPFGVAPALGADLHFEHFDLDQLTSAFSFGGMSGRLDGTIANLRLLDWSPVAFDAWLRTSGGGRMSYKAVNDLTAIGGGGGLSSSLQTMALKMFNTFGYRRLGIRCQLRDEVCAMAGIEAAAVTRAGAADSGADGYTIVEGSGVPRITIVGHRRRVDWPTLVRRLQEATQGQGPIIN